LLINRPGQWQRVTEDSGQGAAISA